MKSVELIIFDLDGTLVDSRKDIVNAVNFSLARLGLGKKSESEITSYIGMGVVDLLKNSLGKEHIALLDKAVGLIEQYHRQHLMDKSSLYPHVKETLQYFSDKRKAVVTNKKEEFTLLVLDNLGISDYFEYILGGDDINCLKPSSCPLDITINKFNADRNKAIIVGDMDIDILAGKQAGIATCAVTYGIGKKEDIVKAKPDFIIDGIIELKDIIR